jgi:hypothetical protein
VTVIARKQDNAYRFEKISCFRGNPIIPEHHHPVTVPKVTVIAMTYLNYDFETRCLPGSHTWSPSEMTEVR